MQFKRIDKATTSRDIDRWGFLGLDDVEITIEVRKSKEYQPIELINILHFLITNVKRNDKVVIKTNFSIEELSNLGNRFFDYYLLICIILFKEDVKIKTNTDSFVLTSSIYETFVKKLIAQEDLYSKDFEEKGVVDSTKKDIDEIRKQVFRSRSKNKADGISFLIPCFDHLEARNLHESYYFYGNKTVRDSTDIKKWLSRLFKFNELDIVVPELVDELSMMIKELMQNTHDWARDTFDNSSVIKPNLRVCQINIFLDERLEKDVYSYDKIQEYLSSIYKADRNNFLTTDNQSRIFSDQKIAICEISVLDFGPGMARRWLERDFNKISQSEEAAAVKDCFYKHLTSDTSGKRQLRGRGLTRVLQLIGKRGLLRLRSGGILLLRDFYKHNLDKQELESHRLDFDTTSDLLRIEGTSISVLYPFIYTNKA